MGTPKLRHVWQQPAWPALTFDAHRAGPALAEARRAQGRVEGKAQAIGLAPDGPIVQEAMQAEVIATAAIEGERLDPAAVRSSVTRRLGPASPGPHDRAVDGLVDVINEAQSNFAAVLDDDRLHRWQSALFPGGHQRHPAHRRRPLPRPRRSDADRRQAAGQGSRPLRGAACTAGGSGNDGDGGFLGGLNA